MPASSDFARNAESVQCIVGLKADICSNHKWELQMQLAAAYFRGPIWMDDVQLIKSPAGAGKESVLLPQIRGG